MIKVNLYLDESVWRSFRARCVEGGTSASKEISRLIREDFDRQVHLLRASMDERKAVREAQIRDAENPEEVRAAFDADDERRAQRIVKAFRQQYGSFV